MRSAPSRELPTRGWLTYRSVTNKESVMKMRSVRAFLTACLFGLLLCAGAMAQKPQVEIDGPTFKVNGTAKFLTFVSYYDGWRAPRPGPCADPNAPNATSLQCDLKWIKQIGIDGIRVFPNWIMARDLSDPTQPTDYWFWDDIPFTPTGLRDPNLGNLKQFLDLAGAAGLVVDLTFTRDTVCGDGQRAVNDCPNGRMSFPQYKARIVEALNALKDSDPNRFSHVIIDLQNERNLCGSIYEFQCMTPEQLAELVQAARGVDTPLKNRLSASMTTPDMSGIANVANVAASAQLNFVAWHDPRDGVWFSAMESRVAELRQHLAQAGVTLPISIQETTPWQEDRNAEHLKAAAQGAK